MVAVVALAATLNLWNITAAGYGNLYYAAAVRSMAQSWHNFLFASYDPGGFITVDKPPLGFWAQVVSVKLLGFSAFSLLLPEALAGVLAVVALWRVVRRTFGDVAGVLAALALAISPINVVTNRDNILEPLLTLTLLLAAWAALAAVERGALRWLLVSAALVGLGFNIKMLEAYLIVPALALVYLVGAPGALRRRVGHLLLAGVVMIALSFVWIVAVDMTPAAQRPYVGSTVTNSELELALSYNGAGRLLGGLKFTFAPHAGANAHINQHGGLPVRHVRHLGVFGRPPARASAGSSTGRRHHPANPAGTPGPLRLFQSELGSQVSWLLPLALMGGVLLAGRSLLPLQPPPGGSDESDGPVGQADADSLRRHGPSWRRDRRVQGLLLWSMWLLAGGVLFSFARSINAYYVAILAPSICALAGVGAAELWRLYCAPFRASSSEGRRANWRADVAGLLLPLTLLATAAQQRVLLGAAPGWRPWLALALLLGALALASALGGLRLWAARSSLAERAPAVATALATVALAAMLIAPTAWTFGSLTWGNEGGWPSAGPQYASAQPAHGPLVDPALMRYLLAHRGEDRFLVGALNAYLTAPMIVATGQPVLDMGGFTGTDPILTDHELARLVQQDQVHLFLLPSANVTAAQQATLFAAPVQRGAARLGAAVEAAKSSALSPIGTTYTNALTRWISMHCAPVPPKQWNTATAATHRLGAWELFACQS